MKLILLSILFLVGCGTESDPLGIKVLDEWHYETIDACRGIDISDNILVAAASSNGYFRFDITDSDTLQLVNHIADLNPSTGDDAAYDVAISGSIKDKVFVLDDVDGIVVYFFDGSPSITLDACGNSLTYRSLAINDAIQDTTIVFTLQKHQVDGLPNGFDQYSTSVGVRKYFETLDPFGGEALFENDGCNAAINPSIDAMKIFYADNLLSLTLGGLGVQVYKYEHNSDDPLVPWSSFYVQGGEAESIFSLGQTVIGGFDNDRGCYMALLDSDGEIAGNLAFADGYSINAIDYKSGVLALAAGNDGVLIYDWDESLGLDLKGILNVGDDNYVYDVKVHNDDIYVASENGISIYNIK